jgi:hypothetical protein
MENTAVRREDYPRHCIEDAISRRKDEFALSYLVWTADGYIVKFRLGVVDVVRSGVEGSAFDDCSRMDKMLDEVRVTFKALAPFA